MDGAKRGVSPAQKLGNGDRPLYNMREIAAQMWEWDKVVKAAHLTNCGHNTPCSLNLYVKDGVVVREEQTGNYPDRNDPRAPDFNPRGCPRGMCYSHSMYDPRRIQHPLKRMGQRGEGKWVRIGWDQALTEIADKLLDVLTTEGPDVIVDSGSSRRASMASVLGQSMFFDALGSPAGAIPGQTGDDHQGMQETFGKVTFASSADNWFYADMVLIWGGNPSYTHIPNYHYIPEARYNGARIVTISPDHSPSAFGADLWVPVNLGSDVALALAMAHVIISDKLYDKGFVREQTDAPLLVRRDNLKLLREKDLKRGGRDDIFYVWDEKTGKAVEAPKNTLALNNLEPALEGEHEVQTLADKVKITTVFQLLKEHAAEYAPARAAPIVGVSPELIASLARDIARARAVSIIPTMGWGKFYHGDLYERGMMLVLCLCGHIGKKGAGPGAFGVLAPDTQIGTAERRLDQIFVSATSQDPRILQWREQGYTDEMIIYEYARDAFAQGGVQGTSFFYYMHGGVAGPGIEKDNWDPHLKRPLKDYLKEAMDKKWQFIRPSPGRDPQVVITCRGGFLRMSRGTNQLLRELLPKLKLMVTLDWRMGSTALYSDYVLPASGWYERESTHGMNSVTLPYVHYNQKAVEPLFESKSDWEIFVLLARRMDQRAKERGLTSYKDSQGRERPLGRMEEHITFRGLYSEADEDVMAKDVFLNASNIEKMDWEDFIEKGVAHYTGTAGQLAMGLASDMEPGEPVVALVWHTEKKQPYPTMTRRIQFYIDHDWYLELGEGFASVKQDPKAGGDYPLRMTGGHARWSTHSDWADDQLILRLQRGQPIMFMSEQNAKARGVRDGDIVEVFNDVGRFRIEAAVTPLARPGQVIIYHSWENTQFAGKSHFKSVQASPLNPIELVGDYFHIRPNTFNCYPGQNDRDTRVEVRKAGG